MANINSNDYQNWLVFIKQRIQASQMTAALRVNEELIEHYWILGSEIASMELTSNWGDKRIETLSKDLMLDFPGIKGFSKSNLKYIKRWYLFYDKHFTIGQQAVDKIDDNAAHPKGQQAVDQIDINLLKRIPWGHHIAIVTKTSSFDEAIFYLKACIQNNWSRLVLTAQIETELYKRQGKAITNFRTTLPEPLSDLARETLKNPYNFDFLALTAELKERDLERGLIENLCSNWAKGLLMLEINFT